MSIMPVPKVKRSGRSLRPYLEAQADRIEALLNTHHLSARVVGGTAGPQTIRFALQLGPHTRYNQVAALREDMALALGVAALTIERAAEGVFLTFAHPDAQRVTLKAMLEAHDTNNLHASTFILGIGADGNPTAARLCAPEVAHVLISGTTGSGKTVLLKSIAASLLCNAMPAQLQMVCIDPKARTFRAFANVAHLVRPVITEMGAAVEVLESLLRLAESRDARGETPGGAVPRIAVLIDELADVVMQGGERVTHTLTRLVARGREPGIHIIAATQHPSSAILTGAVNANFPLRICGKVVSAQDARVATGQAGTNAHTLNGRGDFIAVGGGECVRFQAAYTDDQEVRKLLAPYYGAQVDNTATTLRWAAGTLVAALPPGSVAARPDNLTQLSPRPALPAPVDEPSARVQEAVRALRPQWATLRQAWLSEEWGIKTRLVRLVWGAERRYEGAFAEWLEAAVAELEQAQPAAQPVTAAPRRNRKAHILAHIRAQQEVSYA